MVTVTKIQWRCQTKKAWRQLAKSDFAEAKPNPDNPEPRKIITKARKNENTKNGHGRFRAFSISYFRDEDLLIIGCKENHI
jgi:hypothetical protein